MSTNTKAIVAKGTTPEQIVEFVGTFLGTSNLRHGISDMYTFQGTVQGTVADRFRNFHVWVGETAELDYGIPGVMVGSYGDVEGINTILQIVTKFGGYYTENDNENIWTPINLDLYRKPSGYTPQQILRMDLLGIVPQEKLPMLLGAVNKYIASVKPVCGGCKN
jgi:hypothetical protein